MLGIRLSPLAAVVEDSSGSDQIVMPEAGDIGSGWRGGDSRESGVRGKKTQRKQQLVKGAERSSLRPHLISQIPNKAERSLLAYNFHIY